MKVLGSLRLLRRTQEASLRETQDDSVRIIKIGEAHLWRAQIGHEPDTELEEHGFSSGPLGYPPERMKPLRDAACEGRVNPKGMPVLYLASTPETAMSEIRPWLQAGISVACFEPVNDLRLVDCTIHKEVKPLVYFFGTQPKREIWNDIVWSEIDYAFSAPVSESEDKAEYVPTQIISEAIKNADFDGIIYKSSLGDGHNIALFDCDSAQLIYCTVHSARNISYTFEQSGNPYWINRDDTKHNFLSGPNE